jgi:hypothetical protein
VTAGSCLQVVNNYQEDVVLVGELLQWFHIPEHFTVDDPDLRNNPRRQRRDDWAAPC